MGLLRVRDLQVTFRTPYGAVNAVRGVSFDVAEGETVALVGESGCGKSVTALAMMGLLPKRHCEVKGGVFFDGKNLTAYSERKLTRVRGGEIGMAFQDPMTALNPTMKVGKQIAEGIRRHRPMGRTAAKRLAIEMLRRVEIPMPEKRYHQYPHEFSGGMRQRAMIAMALACEPRLLIADEPTTALDVTIQAQLLDLLKDLQDEMGTSILLITHDLGVVAGTADRVVVMYAGQVVETGTVEELFRAPRHPYTQALLNAVPRVGDSSKPLAVIPGSPPPLTKPIEGCAFAPRCPYAMEICKQKAPIEEKGVRCWLHDDRAAQQLERFEGVYR